VISTTVFDCNIIHFPRIENRSGNITAVENGIEVPFDVKRIYYLYDIPGGKDRGAHAHKALQQVIIAASGSFDITIDDGKNKKTVHLSRPYFGLHVLPGMWRNISNFSSGAICLVISSECYDSGDYLRTYDDFLIFKNEK
jgi:hypothetical protein